MGPEMFDLPPRATEVAAEVDALAACRPASRSARRRFWDSTPTVPHTRARPHTTWCNCWPTIAYAVDPLRSLTVLARIVRGMTAATVLTMSGGTLPRSLAGGAVLPAVYCGGFGEGLAPCR